jgi:hypothetical protein
MVLNFWNQIFILINQLSATNKKMKKIVVNHNIIFFKNFSLSLCNYIENNENFLIDEEIKNKKEKIKIINEEINLKKENIQNFKKQIKILKQTEKNEKVKLEIENKILDINYLNNQILYLKDEIKNFEISFEDQTIIKKKNFNLKKKLKLIKKLIEEIENDLKKE